MSPFSTPVPLTSLNTANQDLSPHLSPDELTIYFERYPGDVGGYDLYVATRPNKTADFTNPGLIPGVNTTAHEDWPTVTGDKLSLYANLFFSGTSGWDL